jgi:hypothetical protein
MNYLEICKAALKSGDSGAGAGFSAFEGRTISNCGTTLGGRSGGSTT